MHHLYQFITRRFRHNFGTPGEPRFKTIVRFRVNGETEETIDANEVKAIRTALRRIDQLLNANKELAA